MLPDASLKHVTFSFSLKAIAAKFPPSSSSVMSSVQSATPIASKAIPGSVLLLEEIMVIRRAYETSGFRISRGRVTVNSSSAIKACLDALVASDVQSEFYSDAHGAYFSLN